MSSKDLKDLVNRVRVDVRSTADEVSYAEGLARQFKDSSSPATVEVQETLRKMLQEIEGRDHRLQEVKAVGHRVGGDAINQRAAHLAWRNMEDLLGNAEQKWKRIANVQFWLGILPIPLVLIAASLLALGYVSIKINPAGGVILGSFVLAAIAYSFLVFRIHQHARQAQERIVEKRLGLAFLRIAVEAQVGNTEFEAMIKAGTQMFLGHHAAATIPLSPEDLRAVLSAGLPSTRWAFEEGKK